MGDNVIKLNGNENSKFLGKESKNTWKWKYTSTTRTVLRNMWLMDFIDILMHDLGEKQDWSIS